MGQRRLELVTNEGRHAKVLFQVAEVTRPLTAVSQTCDTGNNVVYGTGGGFIHNMVNGGRTYFGRTKGGIYELGLWVRAQDVEGHGKPQGFARPGFRLEKLLEVSGGRSFRLLQTFMRSNTKFARIP